MLSAVDEAKFVLFSHKYEMGTEDELRGYEIVLLSAARLIDRMSVCHSCCRQPAGRLLLQGRSNLTRKYVPTIHKCK